MLDILFFFILLFKVVSDDLQCLIFLEEYFLRLGIKFRSLFLNYWCSFNVRYKWEKMILDVKYIKGSRKFVLWLGFLFIYCVYSKR